MDKLLWLWCVLQLWTGWFVMASCTDIHRCGEDTLKKWKVERQQLYLELEEIADNLEQIHVYAEQFVIGGTSSRLVGTLLEAVGNVGRVEVTEIIGLGLKIIGGGVGTGAELYKLKSELKALRSAEKIIVEHRKTHKHLQELAEKCQCHLPTMDYRTLYETKEHPIAPDSEMMKAAKALREALRGRNENSDNKWVNSKITKMQQVGKLLRALDVVIDRDIPLLFGSWETLQGRRVPETVKRLRWLKNELQVNEDQLMMQLENMKC